MTKFLDVITILCLFLWFPVMKIQGEDEEEEVS